MNISHKNFITALISILILKIILIIWTSHPYDFSSFVNTIQRFTLYNWGIFENWNKGNTLILLWYPLNATYLIIMELFKLNIDNLLLLQFFYKIPFIFFDIFSSYLIYKIVYRIKKDIMLSRFAALLWLLNPLIFFIYGIHGHYEILIPFGILILLTGLSRHSSWFLAGIGFVLLFVNKYFIILFLPFILLYYITNKSKKHMIYFLLTSIILTILSYFHFIINPELIGQTIQSIMGHSSINAPSFIQSIKLNPLNLISAINFLIGRDPINNTQTLGMFNFAIKVSLIFILIFIIHLTIRIKKLIKTKKYTYDSILKDLFIMISYFLIFSTNFQKHYLIWLIPLFILLIVIYKNIILFWIFSIYTLLGFITSLRGEFGAQTFFLNIISNFKAPFLINSLESIYLEGTILIFFIILSSIIILNLKNYGGAPLNKNSIIMGISIILICWIFIILVYSQAIINFSESENIQENKLAYGRNVLFKGIIYGSYPEFKQEEETIYFSDKESHGRLILGELNKLSEWEKENFEVYIISKNENLGNISLNNCNPIIEKNKILNYYDNKEYTGLKFNVNCLHSKNNTATLNNKITLQKNEIELYITNKEVNYLYIPSKTKSILFFGGIGILYIISMIYFSIRIINKLK
jgi:hypothetical protein